MSAIEKQLEDFGGGITHHFSDGSRQLLTVFGFVSTQRTRKTLRKWMTF